MGYKRRRFQLRSNGNSTFTLNITSMTDMFTIMLVFLLQTYSTSEVQITPEAGMSLPLSSIETSPTKALKVSLTKDQLKIEDKVIAKLSGGEFSSQDVDNRDSNFIKPLFAELEKAAKENPSEQVKDGNVMMLADSSLSYQTIRKVMYTASMAGFPKLKMATVAGE
ncbi:MAG: hypothetical protein BroJett040_23340 [Oligoflexia bacterium]|nr:MAG: hypothetical protein BroJett040_23340 [Oligoflexia bacterium]